MLFKFLKDGSQFWSHRYLKETEYLSASNIRMYIWFTKKEMAAHLFLSSWISHWSFDIICMALTAVGSVRAWAMGETPLKL